MTKATTTTAKPKKAGRQAAAGTAPAESPEILPAVAERIEAGQDWQLACQHAARDEAQRLGYLLPADSADPDLIQRDIAANMRRSVEAVLEIGKGLIVLKAACGHGNFKARLQVLGMESRVAQRFMRAAIKFSNATISSHLLRAAGNSSKLFELLVLDDESIQALEEDGVTASGLTLDDIDRMSTSELRAALREAKVEGAAQQEVLDKKNARIDKLERDLQRIKRLPPDEAAQKVKEEAGHILAEVMGAIRGNFRQALRALSEAGDQAGEDNTIFCAGLLGQVTVELARLREEFRVPDVSEAATTFEEEASAAIRAGLAELRAQREGAQA